MQLVINTYGSYLQRNGDLFKIRTEDDKVVEGFPSLRSDFQQLEAAVPIPQYTLKKS